MNIIQKVINLLERLPGVGPKTAQRYVYYLLSQPQSRLEELGHALLALSSQIYICQRCFNFSQQQPICHLCSSNHRDESLLCVVAKPQDIESIEKSDQYHGLYFVLGGLLNPLYGIEPRHLRFEKLLDRFVKNSIPLKEVILAINPTLEGENTIRYIKKISQPYNIYLSIPARGLPIGADLGYADEITLSEAFKRRQEI